MARDNARQGRISWHGLGTPAMPSPCHSTGGTSWCIQGFCWRSKPATQAPPHALAPLLLDYSDDPEIIGQIAVEEVGIRHRAIAFHPPPFPPRIAEDGGLLGIVVADR
jgi:hypothetical protein